MNGVMTIAKKTRKKPAPKAAPAAPRSRKATAKTQPMDSPKESPKATTASDDDDGPARSNPLGLEIDAEVMEFIAALDRFKKDHGRPFPSWSEVLHVLRALGYQKLPFG
jgi:hypothetical protein